jgi:hypothetical protein
MKKSWIAVLVVLIVVFVGCKETPDVITPPTPKSPEFVLAIAIPAIVENNGTTIIFWKVKNAEKVIVDGVEYIGNEGSKEIKNLKVSITIPIVAIGEKGLQSSTKIDVLVLPAPNIKTAIDTLCSRPFQMKPFEYSSKDGGKTWKENDFPEMMKNLKYVFSNKNGELKVQVYVNGVSDGGIGPFFIDLNKRVITIDVCGQFQLTDTELIVIFKSAYIDDTGEHPMLCKRIYTRL